MKTVAKLIDATSSEGFSSFVLDQMRYSTATEANEVVVLPHSECNSHKCSDFLGILGRQDTYVKIPILKLRVFLSFNLISVISRPTYYTVCQKRH